MFSIVAKYGMRTSVFSLRNAEGGSCVLIANCGMRTPVFSLRNAKGDLLSVFVEMNNEKYKFYALLCPTMIFFNMLIDNAIFYV